jgi:hypothetical protein
VPLTRRGGVVPPAGFAVVPLEDTSPITQRQFCPQRSHFFTAGGKHTGLAAKTDVGVPSKIASDSDRKAFRAIDITTLHLTAGYIRDWEAVFEAV